MIKINKNIADAPLSLIPAFKDLFPGSATIPLTARTTHEKRMIIINTGEYIDQTEFNDRYKKDDVKIALNKIYKNKCVFCEQKVEQYHIEHYRPKKIYYWLAFSWDNLILSCPSCNINKGTHFELIGNQVNFDNTEINIRNINSCFSYYDQKEQPKMINPENTNPLGKIQFQKDGIISSTDIRFAYTIEKCKIDRKFLNDERRKILDVFKSDIRSALIENKNSVEQQKEISTIVRKFIRDSQDEDLQFLAFRRYAISFSWLNEMVKDMN